MQKINISQRLTEVPASPIRKLVPFAVAAKRKGVRVYHFNIGDPDVHTPQVMLDVLHKWKQNPIGYSQSQGEPVFLEALKTYYHRLGFTFLDIPDIQVTTGGSEAISWAMFATCNPGDEILVFEPFYANYNSYAIVNGVKIVPILTTLQNGFHLPLRKIIEKKITGRTRAILFCNPNNPTGTVYTKAEVKMLVAIAKDRSLYLMSDEVYREYTYDGKKQVSLLNYMQKIPQQAIVLDSMSKRYSLCGARLGALISQNTQIMTGVLRIGQGRLSAGLVDQTLAAKLTQLPASFFKQVRDEYEKRRDVLYAGLRKIPGVVVSRPEGAFYTIAGLPVEDAEHFCQWLLTDFRLNNETVMLAPAAGFYASTSSAQVASTSLSTGATSGKGKNEVRIAYVLNTNDIRRCIEILKAALKAYNKEK